MGGHAVRKTDCGDGETNTPNNAEIVDWSWKVTTATTDRAVGRFDVRLRGTDAPVEGEKVRVVGEFDTPLQEQ